MAIMCQNQTQCLWLKSVSFYNWRLPFGKQLLLKVFFPTYHFTWLKHKNQFQHKKSDCQPMVIGAPVQTRSPNIWGCCEER